MRRGVITSLFLIFTIVKMRRLNKQTLKKITMELFRFVGELEVSELPFDNSSGLAYFFLLAFVFVIVVVLMNLLTGLAINDVTAIEKVKYLL